MFQIGDKYNMRSKSEELMLRIREYIESYFERYSSTPTVREIAGAMRIAVSSAHTAQVGEIVVALTDEDKNTLKRLLYDDDRQSYYLHPENKDMEDIYVSGLRVQGVATHVIKAL